MYCVVGVIFFVGLVLLGTHGAIQDRLKSDFFNIYKHVAIQTRKLQEKPVTPESVTYYLYTNDNRNQSVQLTEDNWDLLERSKIVFFIHGWTNNKKISWYENLKNAFLTSYKDYAVVQVDWREPANQLYYVSSINTHDVAKLIANVIINLNQNQSVLLDDVLLIGHSLGGQITGFVGKNIYKLTGQKLPRIIALDPAGPLFTQRPDDKRLNKNDAEVVQVIHSDGGTFGFMNPTGTIDFFPNGGSSQPGCTKIDLLDITSVIEPIYCDHYRACEYFVEAVLNPKGFSARKCDSWKSYKDGKCEKEDEVFLGDFTTKATGNFYFETNKDRPYARSSRHQRSGGLKDKLLHILLHLKNCISIG